MNSMNRLRARWKLGPEAIADQLETRRRATIVLTSIAGAMGTVFLALFLAFGNPFPALVLNAVLIVPVISWAWVEDFLLRREVARIARNDTNGGGR